MFKKILAGTLSAMALTLFVSQPVYARQGWETPSGLTSLEFEEYCDTYFEEKVQSEIPGASIAIISDGEIVFEKGYGYSDIENQRISNPAETVYEYGSVSKLFTWVSLMKLYEQGEVDLHTDIREYLPEDFELPTAYDKPITILDLMNHQAGFDDYIIHLFSQKEDMVSLREALEENRVQQIYEPGFASSYSNYGAGLAGYIVENVAQMPAYEFVQEQIMQPIGMEHAVLNPDIFDNEELLKNKAKVYGKTAEGFPEENWSFVPMYPAGAANGTVEELAQFAIALLDEENHPLFEKAETQAELLSTSYHGAEGVAGIAHGFVEFDGEADTYWHNGGTDHSSTFFAVVPEKNFGIVLCTNSDNISAIQRFGFEMLQKRKVSLQTPEENLPSTAIVEGSYLDFREDHRGITKLLTIERYMLPITVKAINDEQISISGSICTQVEPYIYQDMETGEKVSFQVEDGKVIKYSNMIDYLKVPQSKIVWNWIKVIVLVLFVVSLLAAVIITLVLLIKKKFRKYQILPTIGMAGWIFLIGSFVVLIQKITEWNTFATLQPQLIVNRIIAIVIAALDAAGIYFLLKKRISGGKKAVGKGEWILGVHVLLSILTIGVVATLGGFSIFY